MQIESLKVFCDLAETESFTKAAQINQVTQSAVSQQISSLERQFKSLLIERSKKKFRLTREGQVLYDYSKQIIQTYDALHSKLQEIKDIISGTIRVATIYSIGLHDLPPYIKRFLKDYPTVHVHVEYRRANQVYDDVLGNVADLGLVDYPRTEDKPGTMPRLNASPSSRKPARKTPAEWNDSIEGAPPACGWRGRASTPSPEAGPAGGTREAFRSPAISASFRLRGLRFF